MNFFQRLNPFYLRKELQRTQLELAAAQNNYERVLSDSEILRKEIETLTTTAENLNDLLEQRTTELKQVKADLEKTKGLLAYSKKVNEAWFNTVLGYGVYDSILLNKAFWGKKLALVELSQEDSDAQNS